MDDRTLDVEPSGLSRDDPATEITGVGPSSPLAGQTAGDFWTMGCPFHEVAPAWQRDALRDLLGADFVKPDDPDDVTRIFAGYTAADVYDRSGEQIGNHAEAMFSQFDWKDVSWAWAVNGMTSSKLDYAAAEDVIEEQAAIATGDELPLERLDYDPEQDNGLSGLHTVTEADYFESTYARDGAIEYMTGSLTTVANNRVFVPYETVEFYSLLFGADYTDLDVASEHVQLVVKTNRSNPEPGPNSRGAFLVVFGHPDADVYGIAASGLDTRPADFDLTESDEYEAWAAAAAEQIETRRTAFATEMREAPAPRTRAGVAPQDQLDAAAGVSALDADDPHPVDRTRQGREDAWHELMGEVYDPTTDVPDGYADVPEDADLYAVTHAEGAHRYIEGFGDDRQAAIEHANEMGADYVVDFSQDVDGAGEDGATEPPGVADPPAEVAGYTLTVEDDAKIEWQGHRGGTPPATIARDNYKTRVEVLNYSGRYSHAWSLRVKYTDQGGTRETRTLASYKHQSSEGPDESRERNRRKAIERAVGWMEEHPASRRQVGGAAGTDQGEEQRSDETTTTDDTTIDDMDARTLKAAKNQAEAESPAVAETLRDRGINNVVASNLARRFDSVEAVQAAVEAASDVTTVHGVGTKSAAEVREAFAQSTRETGGSGNDESVYEVVATYEDGSEQVVATEAKKAEAHIAQQDWRPAADAEAPEDVVVRQTDESGAATTAQTATDGGAAAVVDPSTHHAAREAARQADPDGNLPGPALQALKKAWSTYKAGISEGKEAAAEVKEYRDSRPDAREAAAIINDIRTTYGQEPIDFDGVEGIPEVDELGGQITADDPGISLDFTWSADPYDPTDEV